MWQRLSIALYLLLSFTSVGSAQSPFSIVLLPDTQHYTRPEFQAVERCGTTTCSMYHDQANWIVANRNRAAGPIKFVVSLGDMTDHNYTSEWTVAKGAHTILDTAQMPYSVTSGNHDLFPRVYERQSKLGTSGNFPPEHFSTKTWSGYGGSYIDDAANQSNYFYFSSGGLDFMVLSLEYAPRKDVVAWANKVITQNNARRVIIVTHSHVSANGYHNVGAADKYNFEGREAVDLWNELIARHSNVFMVLSGHIQGRAYRKREGFNRNVVHEILTDFQSEPIGGNGAAFGNGWLRVLTFRPDAGEILVETISSAAGNTTVFPARAATATLPAVVAGTPTFYLDYPTRTAEDHHNKINYPIQHDLKTLPVYAYNSSNAEFRDRMAHRSLVGNHTDSRIAAAPNGDFVVVWEDDQDGNGVHQIHARGFYRDGAPKFNEIVVNEAALGEQVNPDVAMDETGGFVVVWQDDSNNNGVYEILARGFNANGVERFDTKTVNTVPAGQQYRPTIGMDKDGAFAVAWEDDQDDNGYFQILARGFTASGNHRFGPITVNSVADGQQYKASMGMDRLGKFVVAWEEDRENDGSRQIRARGFTATGANRVNEIQVNIDLGGEHREPAVALDGTGNFVVTWQDDSDGNGWYQVLARGFSTTGVQTIASFTVNGDPNGQQTSPTVAMNDAGSFVIAWEDSSVDANYDIVARAFNANGTERIADTFMNSDDTGKQLTPAAAFDEQGRFVLSFSDNMRIVDDPNQTNYLILVKNLTFCPQTGCVN